MQQKSDSSASKTTPQPTSAEKSGKPQGKLDFEKLDLTVEEVEERISPSETNVFDK